MVKTSMDPKSTSTPNKIGPRKRKGIHDSVISPVSNAASEVQPATPLIQDEDHELEHYDGHVFTDEDEESEDEHFHNNTEEGIRHSHREKSSVSGAHDGKLITVVFSASVLICIIVSCLYFTYGDDSDNITAGPTIFDLKTDFPLQSKEFWLNLQSGISDVKLLNRPSIYIFLYEESDEITLEKMLKNISVYANCVINSNCEIKPVVLKGEKLNSPQLVSDYGLIISRYGPQLQEKHVMIIRNLDKVHSNVAQALHSFCDEYTPLVSKSLFLFTVKVDKFEDEPLHQVLKILRDKWKDLGSDKLEPLLTRISSMVLRITAEITV